MQPVIHRNLAVLRVAEAHIFEEIRAVLPLEDYVLGWISDTEVVVDPRRIKELCERLDARGMLPLVKRA